MGTDGLFDNLFDKDIEACLSPSVTLQNKQVTLQDPTKAATCIGNKAYQLGKDKSYKSPFAVNAV